MTKERNWTRQMSAGGVVYKRERGKVYILLIMPKGPNYGPPTGYWTFPKGLLDHDDENKEAVALREVKEEGGVEAEIKEALGYVTFFRKSKDFGNALKFVHFWLMEYKSGDPADHDEEVADAGWYEFSDAEKMISYKTDKEILEKAKKILLEIQ